MFSTKKTTITTTFSTFLFTLLLLLLPTFTLARHPASTRNLNPTSATPSPPESKHNSVHHSHILANLAPFLYKAATIYTTPPVVIAPVSKAGLPRRSSSSGEKRRTRKEKNTWEKTGQDELIGVEEGRMLLQGGMLESLNVRERGEGGREVGQSKGGL